jgi:hypothetical protein
MDVMEAEILKLFINVLRMLLDYQLEFSNEVMDNTKLNMVKNEMMEIALILIIVLILVKSKLSIFKIIT